MFSRKKVLIIAITLTVIFSATSFTLIKRNTAPITGPEASGTIAEQIHQPGEQPPEEKAEPMAKVAQNEANGAASSPKLICKPVLFTDHRRQLAREYSKIHYGVEMDQIVPQAIVIHWTADSSWRSTYNYFYDEEATNSYRQYGKLNLTSHYLVDRDGTIYQLTPDDSMNRHAIGLNWCSIGIENVGGSGGKEDLTDAQLVSNEWLVRHLISKYPTVKYLLGHYQQGYTKKAGLWKENMEGYYTAKPDPGPKFMRQLIDRVKDTGINTFPV